LLILKNSCTFTVRNNHKEKNFKYFYLTVGYIKIKYYLCNSKTVHPNQPLPYGVQANQKIYMKKFVIKFNQIIRNAEKQVVATISSEVEMEGSNNYQAFTNAEKFLLGLLPDAEIEVTGVSSTKPRKEKAEVATEATAPIADAETTSKGKN
jgi:hypothetical protein